MHPMMRCLTGFVLVGCSVLSGAAFAEEVKSDEPPAVKVGYKDGLFVETGDGNYRVHLFGYTQARYTYNALKNTNDNSTFAVQRGKIGIDGHIFRKEFKYKFQMVFGTRAAATTATVCTNAACTTTAAAVTAESTTGQGLLEEYYLDWVPIPEFGLQVGQGKTPFLLQQELTPDIKQSLVDRSLATTNFAIGRDIGLVAHGALANGHLRYAAFAMNGEGINNLDRNRSLLTGLRLEVPILGAYEYAEPDLDYSEAPNLGVGGAVAWNRQGTVVQSGSIPANNAVEHATVDVMFKWRGLSLITAAMLSRQAAAPHATNWGFYSQAGYFIVPKRLEAAVRGSGVIFKGATANQYEYSGGLNYYIKGHQLKIQTDYALLHNTRAVGMNDHRFRTQVQVMF